jgi:D-beta-D-heptose 7-phosphate kinase/D-beta-D-heptose 1-phosphate adenosyltransferase
MNNAGLGCQTFLAGFWGSDTEQAELASIMQGAGIDTVCVVSSSLPTISKTRIVGRTQQLLRLNIESREKHPTIEAQRLLERATELAGKVHAVILSDYAKGALSNALCEAVIRAARASGVPVLADPRRRISASTRERRLFARTSASFRWQRALLPTRPT